ncbi:hypothetical protein [Methylophaga sp.]|uniref:hypothetical protein n=1 Tax=Methylophaga sp. TaxID=2024840 RepID=UPI003F69C82C
MMMRLIFVGLCFFTLSIQAEPLQRGNITSCAYQAGTAVEIQKIRQQEGDNWETFEAKIKNIYQDSQGRTDLLIIAERVFIEPVTKSADEIHELIFNACIQRQQGTEPVT